MDNQAREALETLRRTLLANGYSPIPNRDKRTFHKGWPNVEITDEVIGEWSRRSLRDSATGLRVENGLMVIDLDINDKAVVDEIANRILDICPQLDDPDAVLSEVTGYLVAARSNLQSGLAIPGPDTGDDYDDLAFALPANAGPTYCKRKRPIAAAMLGDAAQVWEAE